MTAKNGDRIREVARRLRYIPHAAARLLITRRTDTSVALLPDLCGEFFRADARHRSGHARGLHRLVSRSHDRSETWQPCWKTPSTIPHSRARLRLRKAPASEAEKHSTAVARASSPGARDKGRCGHIREVWWTQ